MKKIFSLIASLILTTAVYAQKFGYINTQELLAGMSEVKAADNELEAHQTQLVAKGQVMVKEFETAYKNYMEEANKGLISKVQMQKKEEELNQKRTAIQAYEQDVQTKLAQKREDLYKPILDKVTETIKTYGKENGYTMIFDTSAGMLLYAVEAENLLEPIKKRLSSAAAVTSNK